MAELTLQQSENILLNNERITKLFSNKVKQNNEAPDFISTDQPIHTITLIIPALTDDSKIKINKNFVYFYIERVLIINVVIIG